jgi:uncharacterized membrane protein HdeD (DUF308 family)
MPTVITVDSWWAFVLRGVATMLFGAVALLVPEMAVSALALLFGAFAVVAGAFDIVAAVRKKVAETERWWALLAAGVASIIAGAIALVWPGLAPMTLLYLLATCLLATGILEIAASVQLRKEIHGEWLLLLSGLMSAAFGLFLAAFPGGGLGVLFFWIGVYALPVGVLLVVLGVELRRYSHMTPSEHQALAASR